MKIQVLYFSDIINCVVLDGSLRNPLMVDMDSLNISIQYIYILY